MNTTRETSEALLDAHEPNRAIEALIADGPPTQGWQFALLARAYQERGDSRGDRYAGSYFANRAREAGFDKPWLIAIVAQYRAVADAARIEESRASPGGLLAERPDAPSPYPFSALSVQHGDAVAPKDFDWAARNVPCQAACPAGTDIPGYLTAIFDGDYAAAYRINLASNVFPGVLGRVCARPCEAECRHGWDGLGDSVAICFSKRAAADLGEQKPVVLDKWFPPTGRHVAVVGAGVAGLTVARELALWGHRVTVYEKHATPGGMMDQGIPEFRLPRDVIAREIEQIRELGVVIECGVAIGEAITLEALRASHDAVVLAAGTLRPNLLDLPGRELAGVRHGLDFLLEANTTGTADVGRRVVVIGGGFTAMDCARTARRLGAAALGADGLRAAPDDLVKVWYRRTAAEMLITPGELEALNEEGIAMAFLVSPVRYIGVAGRVTAVEFIRNELGTPDASGRRRPVPIPGSEFHVSADTVLLATGQFPATDWITGRLRDRLVGDDGWLSAAAQAATGVDGIFAAGDFVGGASSLIGAIGHARGVARAVDTYLGGAVRVTDKVTVSDVVATGRIREMDAVPVQALPMLPVARRDGTAEVELGYDAAHACDEAQRCYRCHYKYEIDSDKCIYCDWCIKAKPRPECILRVRRVLQDAAGRITGWEPATGSDDTCLVWINQADCIRCGACVDACPVDAISLQKACLTTAPAREPQPEAPPA